MTRDTPPDDPAKRANHYPDDASIADIEAALRGRQLFDNIQRIDCCRRCEEKNTKRRSAGVDCVDPTFQDGDKVTVHAVHDADSNVVGPHWRFTAVAHRRHPQVPFEETVQSGTDFVRAHARVHDPSDTSEGFTPEGQHLLDIDIVDRSPRGDGPQQSRVGKRAQQYIVEGDGDEHPKGATVIERPRDEAPAHWPDEDRQWLDDLIGTHGSLSRRKASFGCDDSGTWDI